MPLWRGHRIAYVAPVSLIIEQLIYSDAESDHESTVPTRRDPECILVLARKLFCTAYTPHDLQVTNFLLQRQVIILTNIATGKRGTGLAGWVVQSPLCMHIAAVRFKQSH